MASLITIRLYNEDWTPKTLASPKLSAIREKDNVKVLDLVSMVEVWEWFYKYNFTKYNKSDLYFFFVDWEQYDDVNKLDSYWNKNTRWRDNAIIIDEDKLAKNIWSLKEKDVKKWTIAEHIFNLSNISLEELNIKVDEVFNVLFKKSNELWLVVKWAIAWIKIPEQINDKKLLENIKILVKTSLEAYSDNTQKALEALENTLVEVLSTIEKYDDSGLLKEVKTIFENISNLSSKIETFKSIDKKVDLNNNTLENVVNQWINWINKELAEINRKMIIVFSRLNQNK